MDVYKIELTEPAENDIRDIARYIAAQLNAPVTAINMVNTIRKAISKLETGAFLNPLVRDDRLATMGYRALVIKNDIAFYIINEKEKAVVIDRIIYRRRDWQNII